MVLRTLIFALFAASLVLGGAGLSLPEWCEKSESEPTEAQKGAPVRATVQPVKRAQSRAARAPGMKWRARERSSRRLPAPSVPATAAAREALALPLRC